MLCTFHPRLNNPQITVEHLSSMGTIPFLHTMINHLEHTQIHLTWLIWQYAKLPKVKMPVSKLLCQIYKTNENHWNESGHFFWWIGNSVLGGLRMNDAAQITSLFEWLMYPLHKSLVSITESII
mmetsp:Transcript_21770/g.45968  ORF Transcript_21770/g.45968 Transcript_21770/m.45968 type:complete len:124 (-) Transcript_21770:57-428(-)